MDQNGYNRDKCMEYFQAYRDCKRTWVTIRVRRVSPTALLTLHPALFFTDRSETGRPSARPSNTDMRVYIGSKSWAFRRRDASRG